MSRSDMFLEPKFEKRIFGLSDAIGQICRDVETGSARQERTVTALMYLNKQIHRLIDDMVWKEQARLTSKH